MLSSVELAPVLDKLRGAYSDWISADAWEAKLSAFTSGLAEFPMQAVKNAITRAVDERPDKMPSLGHLRTFCEQEREKLYREAADAMRGRMLPAPAPDTEKATQAYFTACDKAAKELRGPVTEDHRWVLEGLVVLLGAVFGYPRARITGESAPVGEDASGFNLAAWLVGDWKRAELSVEAVVKGLRRAPKYCLAFPTYGILQALIRGEPMYGWDPQLVDGAGGAPRKRAA